MTPQQLLEAIANIIYLNPGGKKAANHAATQILLLLNKEGLLK